MSNNITKNILTLTLNPVIDTHYRMEKLVMGEENFPRSKVVSAAGKGINVSRALDKFGHKNTAFFLLGNNNAEEYLQLLATELSSFRYVRTKGNVRSYISLNLDDGTETRICMKDYSATRNDLNELLALMNTQINRNTIVAISGGVPSGITHEDFRWMCCQIAQAGAGILLDTTFLTLEDIAVIPTWLIKINLAESRELLGRDDISAAEAAELIYKSFGSLSHSLVTSGGGGVAYFGKDGKFEMAAPKVNIKSTVGAGDSMMAGIIHAALMGDDFRECVKYGLAFGSAACLFDGTNPPEKDEVERLFNLLS